MLALSTKCVRIIRISSTRLPQIANRKYSTKTSTVEDEEDEDQMERPTFLDDSNNGERTVNRDKSRLLPQHRNMLHGELPYSEPQSWIHLREKYQRKLYGRYGAASGVDPRICFQTQEDLQKEAVKRSLLEPHTLQDMMQKAKADKQAEQERINKREEEIAIKLGKLEQWKQELQAKVAKKEADARAVKERKERLVEEVRRHFGFKVDPRDERFKELLEQKEKEAKRKDKEAKRKAKEEKMVAKLINKNPTQGKGEADVKAEEPST